MIVKVIHTVFIEQPVGIVHPAVRRRVMIDGAVFLFRDLRGRVRPVNQRPGLIGIDSLEMYVGFRGTEMA